jgi:hypothetical protein
MKNDSDGTELYGVLLVLVLPCGMMGYTVGLVVNPHDGSTQIGFTVGVLIPMVIMMLHAIGERSTKNDSDATAIPLRKYWDELYHPVDIQLPTNQQPPTAVPPKTCNECGCTFDHDSDDHLAIRLNKQESGFYRCAGCGTAYHPREVEPDL